MKLYLPLLLVLFLVAGCTVGAVAPLASTNSAPTAEPNAAATPAGLLQVYENAEAGFSLRLPTDWTVGDAQERPYGTLYLMGPAPLSPNSAVNGSIIVADAGQLTTEQLAAQLRCGASENAAPCDAPALAAVQLRNGIAAQFALIDGNGSPLRPWYFVTHDNKLVALTVHDAVQTEQSLEAIVQSLVFGQIVESGGEEMAALQAARQTLATTLDIHPYALQMESIVSTDWPDSCLGVHSPEVMCAAVTTPGYAVTLSWQGQFYQVNSNADGTQVAQVPVTGAPTGGLSLTWEAENRCHLAIVQPANGVQTGFCDGPLTTYPFSSDTSDTVAQLDALIAPLAPFYAETPLGTLNVNGSGTAFAGATQQRQIAEMARWLTETAIAGRSSAADQLIFSWHREGGIAGFCDDLAVYRTGLVQATSCQGTALTTTLSEEQLTQLYDWLDTLSSFDLTQRDPAGAADAMTLTLLFQGNGHNPATAAQQQEIIDFAGMLYNGLTAPSGQQLKTGRPVS
ncbi:MAG TPA: hypothetical protein P5121_20855 [Caldilineaceae bacterium]|nr:hypothetical protein [Caldilineaceae bacterium]